MKYLTVDAFADALGVSRHTIYKRIAKGEIKTERPGNNTILILAGELNKWRVRMVTKRLRLERVTKRGKP